MRVEGIIYLVIIDHQSMMTWKTKEYEESACFSVTNEAGQIRTSSSRILRLIERGGQPEKIAPYFLLVFDLIVLSVVRTNFCT